jgi:hypothetical protein
MDSHFALQLQHCPRNYRMAAAGAHFLTRERQDY